MFSRLIGQETEYAIRVELRREDVPRPPNDVVFSAIADSVEERFACLPGRTRTEQRRLFLENGGTVYYETLPQAVDAGLVEGATPECRGPSELLLYQRAQDELLRQAAEDAYERLFLMGIKDISLIKNCRDGFGNVYGTHENYEATLATGWRLWAYRVGVAALLPLLVVMAVLLWSFGLLFALAVILFTIPMSLAVEFTSWPPADSRFGSWLARVFDPDGRDLENWVGQVFFTVSEALSPLVIFPYAVLLRLFAFREIRQGATAFLLSRCAVTGAGTVEDDGSFGLSERAGSMTRLSRLSVSPDARGIYDFGNLFKSVTGVVNLRARDFARAFDPVQRLQLGLTDANACQIAEYLKIATTVLVMDMAEEGWLDDAPQFDDELESLMAFHSDPTLETAERTLDGRSMTALDVQRWYLQRAREYVQAADTPSLEAFEVLELWEEVLDSLATYPEQLVGRLDWVTKRYLLERATKPGDVSERKKLSIKYHQLGRGYHAKMQREGLSPVLVSDDEIDTAMRMPPQDTPARLRSRIIRRLQESDEKIAVDWTSVKVGGTIRGKVVRLEDFRLD